jgi:hypothetical protein
MIVLFEMSLFLLASDWLHPNTQQPISSIQLTTPAYSIFDPFSRSTATSQIAGTHVVQRKPHGRVQDEC